MHFAQSDYTPFAYERTLRAERPTKRGPTVGADSGAAGRLLRSSGPAVEPVLSSLGQRWRDQFEAADQPRSLCTQYPRIANRLALCWADSTLTKALFDELLVDRRGGRKGFPAAVQAELRRLAMINGARRRAATENAGAGIALV